MICGKITYSVRQEAIDSIKGQHKDKRFIKSKIKSGYSYFCVLCQGWHISSNEQKRPKIKATQNRTETPNIANKLAKDQVQKSATKQYIIHSRLSFKVK